jgi:putative membrane protein
MITRVALAAAATAVLLATPLIAQDAKKSGNNTAQTFVEKAASGGMLEVESSKLAKDKAKRADVKSFADIMIRDHGKANEELKSAAQSAGLNVPAKMAKKHESKLGKLKGAKAGNFDKAYVDLQVEAHREAVELFQGFSRSGEEGELKSFASRTLPILEQHQEMAKDLQKASSGATGQSSGTTGKSK